MVKLTEQDRLAALITARFERSIAAYENFFNSEADRIALACRAMARRFHQGGRLLSFGNSSSASDAQHIAVEFVHPVLVGKRALPALALTTPVSMSAPSEVMGGAFAHQLRLLARPQDIAIGFSPDGQCLNVKEALQAAQHIGLLTVAITGGDGGRMAQANLDFCFVVRDYDSWIVQETHRTLYHVLWELVHVFLEHENLLIVEDS